MRLMATRITILALETAFESAVHGTKELAEIANEVADSMHNASRFETNVLTVRDVLQSDASMIGDVVLVPPTGRSARTIPALLRIEEETVNFLKSLAGKSVVVCGCCTSVFLLAEAGLLNGKRATTTWWKFSELVSRYPRVTPEKNSMIVDDGSVITCSGPFSFPYLMLHLTNRFIGNDVFRMCAKYVVVEPGRSMNGIFTIPTIFEADDPFLVRVNDLICEQLSVGVSVESLADELGLSQRTLHRRISSQLNMSPVQLIAAIRIEVSKSLLETSNIPVAEIANRVGYADTTSYRNAFSKAVGTTPNIYRSRMNPSHAKSGGIYEIPKTHD